MVIMRRAGTLLYFPPKINRLVWDHYVDVRHLLLGWPGTNALGTERYDLSGSRRIPAFPEPGNECVTLYGDSFVYGSDVRDEEAWGSLLSERLGCRVGNFGVEGYGTDQAFLRFQSNRSDAARITILGIYPHDVLRNISQYLYLLGGGKDNVTAFKPRFVLAEGKLTLVPLPRPSFDEVNSGNLGAFLTNETFLPGTQFGPVPFRFPYTLIILKLTLFNEQVRNWIVRIPSWIDFLDESHPSRARQVTVRIVDEFMKVCSERAKECLVVLFPTPSSYRYFTSTGKVATQLLIDDFRSLGIPYLALAPALAQQLGSRSICNILAQPERCVGHFNVEGNQLLADVVFRYLEMEVSSGVTTRPTVRQAGLPLERVPVPGKF
jgi:hypothetical protein